MVKITNKEVGHLQFIIVNDFIYLSENSIENIKHPINSIRRNKHTFIYIIYYFYRTCYVLSFIIIGPQMNYHVVIGYLVNAVTW